MVFAMPSEGDVGGFACEFLRDRPRKSFAGSRNDGCAARKPQIPSATSLKTSILSRNAECVNVVCSLLPCAGNV